VAMIVSLPLEVQRGLNAAAASRSLVSGARRRILSGPGLRTRLGPTLTRM